MKSTCNLLTIFLLFGILLHACSSDDETAKDEERPSISVASSSSFPKGCAVLERGKTYQFKADISDNVALASYSLDIHNNFDHHTHDDQVGDCDLEPIKRGQNPWIFIENYSIENNPKTHTIEIEMSVPDDIDTGNYHCQYSVTDQTGWQSRTSIDIKIIN